MANTNEKITKEISDWLGDIVALESHVEEAMDAQLKLKHDDASLTATFKHFHDAVRVSKQRAVNFQKDYGSTAGNPVIKAGTTLLGKAAGVIDKLRDDSASKALRDDYTAYNHVAIAYTMLYTTAAAFEDEPAKAFAETGLKTYAGLIQELNKVIPEAVVADLNQGDHAPVINPDVVRDVQVTIDRIWSTTQA
jgi:ferritin-like metal-binding protein YciE